MTQHKLFPLFSIIVSILALSVCTGCSQQVGLTGKVVYSDNGEPVPLGEIHFTTPTFIARATIQPDGTFTTGSHKLNDGLPPGTYRIAITAVSADDSDPMDQGRLLIHPKYANADTSGLDITIESTTRNFVIKVDRAPVE